MNILVWLAVNLQRDTLLQAQNRRKLAVNTPGTEQNGCHTAGNDKVCHHGGHYWIYHPCALSRGQVTATHSKMNFLEKYGCIKVFLQVPLTIKTAVVQAIAWGQTAYVSKDFSHQISHCVATFWERMIWETLSLYSERECFYELLCQQAERDHFVRLKHSSLAGP